MNWKYDLLPWIWLGSESKANGFPADAWSSSLDRTPNVELGFLFWPLESTVVLNAGKKVLSAGEQKTKINNHDFELEILYFTLNCTTVQILGWWVICQNVSFFTEQNTECWVRIFVLTVYINGCIEFRRECLISWWRKNALETIDWGEKKRRFYHQLHWYPNREPVGYFPMCEMLHWMIGLKFET